MMNNRTLPNGYLPKPERRIRVMILDKSKPNRLILSTLLNRQQYLAETAYGYSEVSIYDTHVFEDSVEAGRWLVKIEEDKLPDLIIMDPALPKWPGLEMLLWFKRNPRRPKLAAIPVIIVWNKRGLLDYLRARLAGGKLIVYKPFTEEEMLAAIDQIVKTYVFKGSVRPQ